MIADFSFFKKNLNLNVNIDILSALPARVLINKSFLALTHFLDYDREKREKSFVGAA